MLNIYTFSVCVPANLRKNVIEKKPPKTPSELILKFEFEEFDLSNILLFFFFNAYVNDLLSILSTKVPVAYANMLMNKTTCPFFQNDMI